MTKIYLLNRILICQELVFLVLNRLILEHTLKITEYVLIPKKRSYFASALATIY